MVNWQCFELQQTECYSECFEITSVGETDQLIMEQEVTALDYELGAADSSLLHMKEQKQTPNCMK